MADNEWVAAVSLGVSVLAFLRPEFAKGITKFIGGLEFYQPDRIEVGYGLFGPVIAVGGSLRSKYGTIFLRTASLTVVRRSDKSTHHLLWKAFRKSNLADTSKTEIEVPTALSIDESQAQRIEIVFSDEDVVARLEPLTRKFRAEFLQASGTKWPKGADINSKEFQDFAESFRPTGNSSSLQLFSKVQDEFYWREGVYDLAIEFYLDKRKRPTVRRFKFVLSEDDEKLLRLNFSKIVDDQIGKSGTSYTFAYPQLTL